MNAGLYLSFDCLFTTFRLFLFVRKRKRIGEHFAIVSCACVAEMTNELNRNA
jgi:hypothetical protein